jgi:hypothetical protein
MSEQNGGPPVPGEMQVIPGPIVTELGRLTAVNAMLVAENAALREQVAAALRNSEEGTRGRSGVGTDL